MDEVFETIAAARNRSAIRGDEAQRLIRFLHDAEAALVQQPMVIPAQERHVVGRGLATVEPMLEVMAIDVALAATARKRAASIARVECSAQRRGHRTLLAPGVERVAARILEHRHEAAVAQQPLHGREWKICPSGPFAEGLSVGVHHHLVMIRCRTALIITAATV